MARSPNGVETVNGHVKELRLVLTVQDFDAAVALYRDALGLDEVEAWEGEGEGAKIAILDAGRATLELVNEPQAEAIDRIEVAAGSPAQCGSPSRSTTARRPPKDLSRPARNNSPNP